MLQTIQCSKHKNNSAASQTRSRISTLGLQNNYLYTVAFLKFYSLWHKIPKYIIMNSSSSKEFLQELKEKAKSSVPEVAEERQTYVDPTDGTVYEWDSEKRGWFPKVLILLNVDCIP